MALPRTRTMGMQDAVLSGRIASVTTAQIIRYVAPFDAYVERLYCVRGGVHSAVETLALVVDGATTQLLTLVTGESAGYVDSFEFARSSVFDVPAGGVILTSSVGTPTQTTPVGIFIVLRRI